MRTYLVTGAAGFIGSKVAERLVGLGHQVVTIDNLSTGYLSSIPKGVEFIEGNLQDNAVIEKLDTYTFDAIYHIAGQSSGEISFDDPVYDLQTNTQSTLLLLKYCLSIKCRKFIYASTMSVYGDQEIMPVSENAITVPKSLYGVGKLASEHYLRIFAQFGIATCALRLFNVYGPGQNLANLRQGMVSIFLAQAIKDGAIQIKGSAERFRDFIYIDDVVNAFIETEELMQIGEYVCYNVCSGIKTTVGELVDAIKNLFQQPISATYYGSTVGDQFGIVGNNDAIKSKLNWAPHVSLTQGLLNMFTWANIINK